MNRIYMIAVACFATLTAWAQNIAVVSPGNVTTIYQTLDEAIAGAISGSTIYLPGGGFQISNETTIDKKLTIMGVSHRTDTDNADGATVISGRLNFVGNSSGSAVLGVFISGNIEVGDETNAVKNLTIKYCNVNSIQVHNAASSGMFVNQCYLRNPSNFGSCNVQLENSIVHSLGRISGGTINHNIITTCTSTFKVNYDRYGNYYSYALSFVNSSVITNNFFLNWGSGHNGGECQVFNNCIGTGSWGENPVVLDDGKTWNDVFYTNKGVNINSDYRIKEKSDKFKGSDGTYIGIEGGSGFKKEALAPIPRIVSKKVAEQADGTGKLKIEVTVKAN